MPLYDRYADTRAAQLIFVLWLLIGATSHNAIAAELTPFRIGTGGSAGTYFPVGSLIAEAINSAAHDTSVVDPAAQSQLMQPLLALPQRSSGSISNVRELHSGLLEAALVQADVLHWAYNGSGPFLNQEPMNNLRAVASLYLESVHLVARRGSDIESVADLEGKRVSLDESGSGTLYDALSILRAFSLSEDNMKAVFLKPLDAIDRMRENKLDAFFIIAGYPITAIGSLIANDQASVIPIKLPNPDSFAKAYPFFTHDVIPAGTYDNVSDISTLAVAAQLVTRTGLAEAAGYQITSVLWSERTRDLLISGHPKGRDIKPESALVGIDVPLHAGAHRFYEETGMLPVSSVDK